MPEDTESENTFLEDAITECLQEKRLIPETRQPIPYMRADIGANYRRGRTWIMDNINQVAIAGLIVAGGVAYFSPKMGIGIGAASIASLAGKAVPLDEYLFRSSNKVALQMFKNSTTPWKEAYDALAINRKKRLDYHVLMAETASAVYAEFSHPHDQRTLGIKISRIADILSETTVKNRRIKGLSTQHLIDMILNQEFVDEDDREAIDALARGHTAKTLARYASKKRKMPGMDALLKYLDQYEFILNISEVSGIKYIGTELSKGHLRITGDIGPSGGAYLGVHSAGQDFPRLTVYDAEPFFMKKSKRGLGIVYGDAEQGLMENSTGGIAIVRNQLNGRVVREMDDKDWPAVVITYGGTSEYLNRDDVRNGLVISLDRNRGFTPDPLAYRFRDGDMEKKRLVIPDANDSVGENKLTHQAADIVREYIKEWKPRGKGA